MLKMISEAFANTAATGTANSFLPLILIFVVFYFLLFRPQQKKVNEHKLMVDNLKTNDKIITSGGVFGKITQINKDNTIIVEIAQGTEIKILRSTVATLAKDEEEINKTTKTSTKKTTVKKTTKTKK